MDKTIAGVEVVKCVVEEMPIIEDIEITAAMSQFKKGPSLFPLGPAKLCVEIKNCSTYLAHALVRTMIDEMPGHCLTFQEASYRYNELSDPFMISDFIRLRLRTIPLRYEISDKTLKSTFSLNIVNNTPFTMPIYSGDLVGTTREVICGPMHMLGFVQPGKSVVIDDIHIVTGYGKKDAVFSNVIRGGFRPLDLEKNKPVPAPTSEDKFTWIKEARNFGQNIARGDFVTSSLVATPSHYYFDVINNAALWGKPAETLKILLDACDNLSGRFDTVRTMLTSMKEGSFDRAGIQLILSDGNPAKLYISIANETNTLGVLLKWILLTNTPTIGFCGYTCVPHEQRLTFTIKDIRPIEDIRALLDAALHDGYRLFTSLRIKFQKAANIR